ncbi:MAG: hypothetical protein ACSLFH_14490 [Desulfuromonadales bacterium]
MRADKKDQSVLNMLKSERSRCENMAERLCAELGNLPKGSLGERKVKNGKKVYAYPCLRYRDGEKVVFKHLSREQAEECKPLIERRKKLEAILRANKKRIATIDTIVGKD